MHVETLVPDFMRPSVNMILCMLEELVCNINHLICLTERDDRKSAYMHGFLLNISAVGPLLLPWVNFDPNLDKEKNLGWNYLSIPKFNGAAIKVWDG